MGHLIVLGYQLSFHGQATNRQLEGDKRQALDRGIKGDQLSNHPVYVRLFMWQMLTVWPGPPNIDSKSQPGPTAAFDVPEEWCHL